MQTHTVRGFYCSATKRGTTCATGALVDFDQLCTDPTNLLRPTALTGALATTPDQGGCRTRLEGFTFWRGISHSSRILDGGYFTFSLVASTNDVSGQLRIENWVRSKKAPMLSF